MHASGSDDSARWMKDGTDVLRVPALHGFEVDQVIVASVINGGGETGLSCRILDKSGAPVKNVAISLTPPK